MLLYETRTYSSFPVVRSRPRSVLVRWLPLPQLPRFIVFHSSLLSQWFVSLVRGGRALRGMSGAGQDLVGGFGPNEGLGIFIVHVDEFADGRFQVFYTAEHAPTNSLVGEFGKPSLHQVDPGSVGGSEVDMKAWMFGELFRMMEVLWVP